MRAVHRVVLSGLILLGANLVAGQYGYNYDANYYDDYSLYTAGYHYDMYDDDEDGGVSFNPYTNSYEDSYSDYYWDNEEAEVATCRIGADGKPVFNGTPLDEPHAARTQPCDLLLSGADSELNGLTGGIDGNYKVWSCQNGRPLYKRENSPPNEDRILWYSDEFRDWDLVNGTSPREDDILVYGGSGAGEKQPDHVSGKWSVASEFLKESGNLEDYAKFDLKVTCEDGQVSAEAEQPHTFGRSPLLTHNEMDAQYQAIYARASAKGSGAEVNLGLVTIFVMIGLGIVFGFPYMVAKTRAARRQGKPVGMLGNIIDFTGKRTHTS